MEDTVRIIRGYCGEFCGDFFYIYAKGHNGIYVFDMMKKKFYCLRAMTSYSCAKEGLSHSSIKYKEFIYFLPGLASSVLKFSMTTKERKEITIKEESLSNSSASYTVNPVIYRDQLYLLPVNYTKIIPCISLTSDKVSYIKPQGLDRTPPIEHIQLGGHFYGYAKTDNSVFRACKFGPYIQKYNLAMNNIEYLSINGFTGNLRDIVYDGKYFWILPSESKQIIKWDEKENKVLQVIDFNKYLVYPVGFIQAINCIHNNLYITFSDSNEIIEMYLEKDNNIHCYDCKNIPGFICKNGSPFINQIKEDGMGNLCFLPNSANGAVILHKDKTLSFYETSVNSIEIIKALQPKHIFNENMCSVSYFLGATTEEQNGRDKIVGDIIWKHIYSLKQYL